MPINKASQSMLDALLPSVQEIRHFDETKTLLPAAKSPLEDPLGDVHVAEAQRRLKLDRYPIAVAYPHSDDPVPRLEDSYAYELQVTGRQITVSADTRWGILAAFSTLAALGSRGFVPHCHIVDEPKYPWRGLMIDASRHFMTLQVLEETLELMACYRLNVLHLNLSNDQACRFGSEHYPDLAAPAHYTKAELSQLVEFATARGIRVVPELDVPAHTTSWVAAYPEWGAGELKGPSTGFGVHEACLDPTKPEVMDAIKRVFAELAEVFPDSYIHVGGDEVNPTWWEQNEYIQAWMAKRGMDSAHELQAWFMAELETFVFDLGKRTIGWDEVLSDSLSQRITVQAWRGMQARDMALKAGHATLVSSPYYLDLFLPADYHFRYEPTASTEELAGAEAAVLEDPRLDHVRDGLQWHTQFGEFPSHAKREQGEVLGGEACMWSELVDSATLHTRVWSRMPAIAERLWRGDDVVDQETMYRRLESSIRHWRDFFSIKPLLELPDSLNPLELEPLFAQLEPVKWYARLIGVDRMRARTSGQVEATFERPYDLESKFDRVVDFLPPESFEARRVVAELSESNPITAWCDQWRRQAEFFDQCVEQEPRLAELRTLSERLAKLADIHQRKASIDFRLGVPYGEYMLPVATPILHHAVNEIGAAWGIAGPIREITKGHINDTFVIDERMLLQRINGAIFDVQAVLGNRRLLNEHIQAMVPESLTTHDGTDFLEGVDGEVWRASRFVEARNFDVLPSDLCEEAGAAFGGFLACLKTSTKRPVPVIPGFHDLAGYLAELNALEASPEAADLLAFVAGWRQTHRQFDEADFQVIHGDCKVNNLLFDLDTPRVSKVVDLDTLMWGHPAWDFGDLVRSVLTGSVNASEEATRVRKVTHGFISKYPVTAHLVDSFANAPAHMSFMLGVRFLTDHLRGDTYFKVDERGDNLERAREQFELARRLDDDVTNLRNWVSSVPN